MNKIFVEIKLKLKEDMNKIVSFLESTGSSIIRKTEDTIHVMLDPRLMNHLQQNNSVAAVNVQNVQSSQAVTTNGGAIQPTDIAVIPVVAPNTPTV